MKVCNTPSCPNLTPTPRCNSCNQQAAQQRGNRGYGTKGHRAFRTAVLTRDPLCQCALDCSHHLTPTECLHLSTVADHWPTSRKDLIAQGADPNNPGAGRGLCKRCHDRNTAIEQPGGWNNGG